MTRKLVVVLPILAAALAVASAALLALPHTTEAAVAITFTDDAADSTDLTTYTFSSMSFGAAASGRKMVAAVIGGGVAATVSSVTIGGVSASKVVQANNSNGNSAEIWVADVPTGTSGDVVVVWSTGVSRSGVSLYRMTGANSSTAYDTDTTGSTNSISAAGVSGGVDQSVDVPANGGAMSFAYQGFSTAVSWSWSGLTEASDTEIEQNRSMSSASAVFGAIQTGLAVNAQVTGADEAGQNTVMVTASWAPRQALLKPPNNLGLVGYWSFNEGTGLLATDFSGNGNTGTLTNGPTWANGKRGKALSFDGSDDYVNIGAPASLSPTVRTISAWIYPHTLGELNFGTILESSVSWYLSMCHNDGTECPSRANTFVYDSVPSSGEAGEWAAPADTIQFNQWQHIVVVYDCSSISNNPAFYYNGQQITATETRTPTGTLICGDSATKAIGSDSASTVATFDGLIDEVRVYNRALSGSEVAKLYQSGAVKVNASSANLDNGSSLERGLVGHWTFDGADLTDKVYDRSGSGNNGYFVGGATSSAKTIGKLGQAFLFDGQNDYINLPDDSSLEIDDCTVAAWIKTSSDNDAEIFGASEGGFASHYWGIEIGPSTESLTNELITIFYQNAPTEDVTAGYTTSNRSELFDGSWHYIVVTADTTTRLFLDGVEKSLTIGAGADLGRCTDDGTFLDTFRLGNFRISGSNVNHLDGLLDDVRIYNRALSAVEVKQLYKLGTVTVKQ